MQPFAGGPAARSKRGNQPDQNADHRGEPARKPERRQAQVDRSQSGKTGRAHGQKRLDAKLRHQQSERPAQQREHDTLRQKLPKHPATAGAEGHPHREFRMPLRATSEQEVGDVHRRDHEQEGDRRDDGVERRLRTLGDRGLKRTDQQTLGETGPRWAGEFGGRRLTDGQDLARGAFQARGSRQPPYQGVVVPPFPSIEIAAGSLAERGPDLDRGGNDIVEAGWHDPDDQVGITVQIDLPAHHVPRAAESPGREPVAQDDHSGPAPHVVLFDEPATRKWNRAEQREVSWRHSLSFDPFRCPRAGQRGTPLIGDRDGGEGA